MASLDELWRQVTEHPRDIAPRLVLADALLEAGDARGDLFALQCRGADATVIVSGGEAAQGSAAEHVNELVAAHWDTWLGDLARIVERQGTRFRDGMLWAIIIGTDRAATDDQWGAFGGHRELAAVEEVRPRRATAAQYARFLASLARDPRHVELRTGDARAVAALRSQWGVRVAWYAGLAFYDVDAVAADLAALSGIAPAIEQLQFSRPWVVRERADDALRVIRGLPALFPALRSVRIMDSDQLIRDLDPKQTATLRTLSHVELA